MIPRAQVPSAIRRERTVSDTSAGDSSPESEISSNAIQAYAALGRFLEEDGWYPQPDEGKHAYRMHYRGKSGELRCFAQIRMDLEQFVFYAIAPVNVPQQVRPAVAEFLMRANYGLRIGNFEMDYADGEVRFKSSLDFELEVLSDLLIRHAIYPAVRTLDKYLPGLMKVAFGALSPIEAIQEIEGQV
jgi:hypothetical protein